jgi:hypothetical protein
MIKPLAAVAVLITLGAACSSGTKQPDPRRFTAKLHDLGCTAQTRNDGHDVWTASDGSRVAGCSFSRSPRPGDATVEVHVYRTRAKLLSGLGAMRRQTPGEYYIVGRDRATWGAVFNMGQTNLPPVYAMNALGGDPLP